MLKTDPNAAPIASTTTEETTANPSTKLVEATTEVEPHCFFPVGTSFSEIDAKLGNFTQPSKLSDSELLDLFLELKDSAVEHREKFQLLVGTNTVSDTPSWGYSFIVNGKLLYDTGSLPIDKQNVPVALARYEAEYLRQVFSPFSVDSDAIYSAIDKFRESVGKLPSTKEKLDSFAQLAGMVPSGRCADMFLKAEKANPEDNTWRYVFRVSTLCLHMSDNIDQGDPNDNDNDYGYFKQLAMLHGFREAMRKQGCPEEYLAVLADSKIPYGKKGLGTDLGIVDCIEFLATFANLTNQKPSIVIQKDQYVFAIKGEPFIAQVIQSDSKQRADLAMSFLRINSLALQDSTKSIMSDIERYQYQPGELHQMMRMVGLPALPGATPMSLRAAVQDSSNRIQYLLPEKTYSPSELKSSYTLTAYASDLIPKVFSVSAAAPPRVSGFRASISNLFYSSDAFKTETLQLLIKPLKMDVYDKFSAMLSPSELVNLHRQMHQIPLWEGGMTFGQALGVPKP